MGRLLGLTMALITLLSLGLCQAQVFVGSVSASLTGALTTYSPSPTLEGFPVCETGGGDFRMDPPTVVRLGSLFCDELSKPENFPVEGAEFYSFHYPTELETTPGSANYTEIELSGLIGQMSLFRDKPIIVDDTLYIEGTDAQCARDNCTDVMVRIVDSCEYNSHYFGGLNEYITDCGIYYIHIANCTDNWLDPSCDKWHELHPDIGLTKNESLAQFSSGRAAPNSTVHLPSTTPVETDILTRTTTTTTTRTVMATDLECEPEPTATTFTTTTRILICTSTTTVTVWV